jgi:ketosteroid isomerase-like protein
MHRAVNWVPAFAGTLTLMLSASACSIFGPESAEAGPGATGERSGLAREAERLLEADRAFAQKSLELGAPEAFRLFFDDKGLQLRANGEPMVGPDGVRVGLAEGPAMIFSWEPRFAEVFAPGNWGWTWGEWQAHEPGAGGRRLAQGRYVNLWKKQKDGTWKVRADIGNVEREPPAPSGGQ